MTGPNRKGATRLYSWLLRLYPADFRDDFGEAMQRAFEEDVDRTVGWRAGIRLWGGTMWDLLRSVSREHFDRWTHGNTGGWDMWGILDDVRRSQRSLRKTPGFSLAVILTLALGVGATTALYSVVHGVLLAPLPYPDADRIVSIGEELEDRGGNTLSVSFVNALDWKAQATTLESMALVRGGTLTLTNSDQATNLSVLFADPEYFGLLGSEAAVGRLPGPDDNRIPGGHPITVLSHDLWRDAFSSDPGVIGRSIQLGGLPYTVIGVLSSSHREPFPSQSGTATDLWIPSMMAGQIDPRGDAVVQNRQFRTFGVLGKLLVGQTAESAEADLDRIADGLEQAFPGVNQGIGVRVTSLSESLTAGIRSTVLLLMGGAVVLFAIACFNVANLLLVRGSTRKQEIAIQLALGAGRSRLVRLLTIESVLLAVLGGGVGVLVAQSLLPVMLALVPNQLPFVSDVAVNGPVLFMALSLCLTAGVAFGLLPALRASDVSLRDALSGTRGSTSDRAGDRLRSVFVAVELSTATVLLIGSALLVRGFSEIRGQEPGFVTQRVLTARVTLAPTDYPDDATLSQGIADLVAAVEAIPEVEWATPWGPGRPGLSGFFQTSIPDGQEVLSLAEASIGRRQHVGPGTLAKMEIEVLRGRGILSTDRLDSERIAVVGEALAAELWPGQDPLGQVFRGFTPVGQAHDPARTWLVVGVAADARHAGRIPSAGGINTPNDIYFPINQRPERSFGLVVRMSGQPDIAPVRAAIAAFDPGVPVFAVSTLEDLFAAEEAPARFSAILMAIFGASALVLAALGVYGVISFTVSRKTREIGLRAALGSDPAQTLRHFLWQGFRLAAWGVVTGTVVAVLASEAFQSISTTIPELDVLSIAGSTGVLLLVAVLACWFPARRATRVTPVVAMRE